MFILHHLKTRLNLQIMSHFLCTLQYLPQYAPPEDDPGEEENEHENLEEEDDHGYNDGEDLEEEDLHLLVEPTAQPKIHELGQLEPIHIEDVLREHGDNTNSIVAHEEDDGVEFIFVFPSSKKRRLQ